MAAATLSFGPEREAEPAKEARVVGSELVDTYTVCWGMRALKACIAPGTRSPSWGLEEGVRSHVRERGGRVCGSDEGALEKGC